MATEGKEVCLKLVVLGASGSGKTALLSRYVHNTFNPSIDETIGASFQLKVTQLDDYRVKLNIWDSAGSDRFRGLLKLYLRDADCCVLVYDVHSRAKFETLETWVEELERFGKVNSVALPPLVLVGNKVDLGETVGWSEGHTWARSHAVPLFLCSAKTSQGVEAAFQEIIRLGLGRKLRQP